MNVKTASTQDLLEIVGSGRAGHPEDVVAAAEAELSRRAAGQEELFLRKIRRFGAVAAGVGGFLTVWGLSMALLALTVFQPSGADPVAESFVFRNFHAIYLGGSLLEAAVGAVLLWGGLNLRKLRLRGRLVVVATLWIGFGCLLLFTLLWIASLPWREDFDPLLLVGTALCLVNGAFWTFLLWLPYRFLTSQRVRDACGG